MLTMTLPLPDKEVGRCPVCTTATIARLEHDAGLQSQRFDCEMCNQAHREPPSLVSRRAMSAAGAPLGAMLPFCWRANSGGLRNDGFYDRGRWDDGVTHNWDGQRVYIGFVRVMTDVRGGQHETWPVCVPDYGVRDAAPNPALGTRTSVRA